MSAATLTRHGRVKTTMLLWLTQTLQTIDASAAGLTNQDLAKTKTWSCRMIRLCLAHAIVVDETEDLETMNPLWLNLMFLLTSLCREARRRASLAFSVA